MIATVLEVTLIIEVFGQVFRFRLSQGCHGDRGFRHFLGTGVRLLVSATRQNARKKSRYDVACLMWSVSVRVQH